MQMIINQKQIKGIGWSWVSAKTLLFERNYSNSSRKSFLRKQEFQRKIYQIHPFAFEKLCYTESNQKKLPHPPIQPIIWNGGLNKNAGGKSLMGLLFLKCAKSNQMYTWAAHRSTKCTGHISHNSTKCTRHNPTKYAGYNPIKKKCFSSNDPGPGSHCPFTN